jgi:hypothetical protein
LRAASRSLRPSLSICLCVFPAPARRS